MIGALTLAAVIALGLFGLSRVVWIGRKLEKGYREARLEAWGGPTHYRVTQPGEREGR